jgi:hypothetical protein
VTAMHHLAAICALTAAERPYDALGTTQGAH